MVLKEIQQDPVIDSRAPKGVRYEALVNEFYNDLFRYAYWLSKSKPVAEDLTQETFLRAWRSLDSLQNPAAAKAWLFTILRRENARLYERYRPQLDDIEDYSLAEPSKNEPDHSLEREMLHKAINKLDAEYKEPLILQVIGGFSGEEISNILSLNSNTVMTRLFRARKKLQQALSSEDSL